jgi:hypothetical protein
MQVDILRLVDAIKKTMWRHGHVAPEHLKHHVDARGDHHIELTIVQEHAVYAPPKRRTGPSIFPWGIAPPPPKDPE